jgi:hypothetical protein
MKKPTARTISKPAQGVTQMESERAITAFRARGGLIHKLPDEIVLTGTPLQSSLQWEFAVIQAVDMLAKPQRDAG